MREKDHNLWSWGFTKGAENWNGRLAMLGFISMIMTELMTQNNILKFLGFL
uniref:CAB/ELIP/HLIP superfamily protein n=1 Tax=Bangiopsis subsimplex TaxID=139980 RepID=A0A1C9CCQ1_9RHOD|nr:CAB/ELIP/HLIP superfamily protein [Bangiopsis subsimplex]AOM66168.1 CAB/ELIP/HLIP superfamily protein [Bangiopsis subsimplex]ARO90472.1 conserved hypothetical plastid protein [Bangiopsis subsimplex]